MSGALNEQLADIFATGHGLESAAITMISTSVTQLSNVNSRLMALAEYMIPIVDPLIVLTPLEIELQKVGEKIQGTYLPVLEGYQASITSLGTHIEERLEKLFEELSVASALTAVSAFSDVTTTINTIAGSAFGTVDTVITKASNLLDQLDQNINDFSVELLEELTELANFELTLTETAAELTTAVNEIQSTIDNEVNSLSQMYTGYQQHAKAVSVQLLVSNAGTASIIAQLANPELSSLLACITE